MIARGINHRVVHRDEDEKRLRIDKLWSSKFPKDGIVHRGGGFPNRLRDFFTPGKKYRVPGYLATSLHKAIASSFALRAPEGLARVIWKIAVDKRGITDPMYRCKHAFMLQLTHIPGEEEYLFVPYRSVCNVDGMVSCYLIAQSMHFDFYKYIFCVRIHLRSTLHVAAHSPCWRQSGVTISHNRILFIWRLRWII